MSSHLSLRHGLAATLVRLGPAALAASLLAPVAAQAEPLPFLPDPALNNCLHQQAAEHGWLDAGQVQELLCADRGVRDLMGIEMLPNLRVLNVSDNALRDIAPLDAPFAPRLHHLDLSRNAALQIEQVNGLLEHQSELAYLGIGGVALNTIADLRIRNPPVLESLDVSDTGIRELLGIETYANLQRLDVSGNTLHNIHPLVFIPHLRHLNLANTAVAFVQPLERLHQLQYLNLSGNRGIADPDLASVLHNLPDLQHLYLSAVAVTPHTLEQLVNPQQLLSLDVSGSVELKGFHFERFGALESFSMRDVGLIDAYFVSQFPHLTNLDLSHNQLQHVPPFMPSVQLQHLNIANNALSSLDIIVPLNQLLSLDIGGNPGLSIEQLDPIFSQLQSVQSMGLAGTANAHHALFALPNKNQLQILNLANTDISGSFDFFELENLRHLDISNNRIEHLGPLDFAPMLRVLRADNNNLTFLPPLMPHTPLAQLYVANNNLYDIYELQQLQNLTHLDLSGNAAIGEAAIVEVIRNNSGLQSLALDHLAFQWHWLDYLVHPERLITLSVRHAGLHFIPDLSYFSRLQRLDVSHNRISEAPFLDSVANLQYLGLAHNLLGDAFRAPFLPELRHLDVSYNSALKFDDLDELVRGAQSLEFLAASGIQIPQGMMYHFVNPRQLVHLEIASSGLHEIAPLLEFPALRFLDLSGNHLHQIYGLEHAHALTHLKIQGNNLVDIAGIEALTRMQQLDVSYNPLAESALLSKLSYLPSLESLGIAGVGLKTLQQLPLHSPFTLTSLDVSDNQLQDLSGIEQFPALQWLEVDNNTLRDVTPLFYLSDLRLLSARNNMLQSLHGVEGNHISQLTHLDVRDNPLMDFYPLHALGELQTLGLSAGANRDVNHLLGALAPDLKLTQLYLIGFDIFDLNILPVHLREHLEILQVSHGQLQSLFGLEVMHNLRELYVDHNRLTDLGDISRLKRLRKLDISHNDITDIYHLRAQASLELLDVSGNSNIRPLELSDVLSSLPLLRSLAVSDIPLNSLADLAIVNPHLLTSLSVVDSALSHLGGIEGMSQLQKLNVSGNAIDNVYGLDSLSSLRELKINHNAIPLDFFPIEFLHQLRILQVDHSPELFPGSILSYLGNKPHLQDLGLAGVFIDDLWQLNLIHPERLRALNLSGSLVGGDTQLGKLGYLNGLQSLDLSDNNITTLFSEFDLPELKQLNLSGNDLTDIYPLDIMAQQGALANLNLLQNNHLQCEQLDYLQSIPTLQLHRPQSCQVGRVPELTVLAPASNDTVTSGQLFTLSAYASDWEDGDVGANITWISSIDGLLGHGPLLDVALNAGVHIITVSVHDSHDNRIEQAVTITVEAATNYCVARGSNAYYEWVDAVAVNGQEVVSGPNNGYIDHTNTLLPLHFGMNDLALSAGYRSYNYWEHWGVWIDYNRDGQFTSEEQVSSQYGTGFIGTYFMLPPEVRAGTTRMRVVMTWGAPASPCGTFNYGEVEDFSVIIP